MSQHRSPGKRGRLPKLAPADRFPLKYLKEYTRSGQPLPAPSYPVDVTNGITAWGMLGNGPDPTCTGHPNGVGDCTFAGRQHYRMAKAARGQETETWETSNQLVAEYLQSVVATEGVVQCLPGRNRGRCDHCRPDTAGIGIKHRGSRGAESR
jgi:hypothetical protein